MGVIRLIESRMSEHTVRTLSGLTTHRDSQTENWRRIPHGVHHLPVFHVVHLDHVIKTTCQHPLPFSIESHAGDRLLMVAQRSDTTTSRCKIPNTEDGAA